MIKKKMNPDQTDGASDPSADPSIEAPLREVLSDTTNEGKKPSRIRVLLLLLVLAVLGAAAYYLYFSSPDPAAPAQPAPPARQPISIPEKTAAQEESSSRASVPAEEQGPTEIKARTEKEGPPDETPNVPSAVASESPEEIKSDTASGDAGPEKSPIEAEAVQEKPAAEENPPQNAEAASPSPQFTLNAGAYLLEGNLRETERVARQLGYDVRLDEVVRPVEMIRLRIGEFSPEEARARISELKDSAPDAFLINREEGAVVYAASYFDLDRARSFADQLFLKGIRVEEESIRVDTTLTLVNFGEFSDRTSAGKAAEDVREAGLDVQIISTR